MSADPIDIAAWLDFKRRDFPPGTRCADCRISWSLLLQRVQSRTICYRCAQVRFGKAAEELHHIGGEPSDLVVLVPANLHRILSLWQALTWRGVVEPASPEAIRLDLIGLVVLGSLLSAVD